MGYFWWTYWDMIGDMNVRRQLWTRGRTGNNVSQVWFSLRSSINCCNRCHDGSALRRLPFALASASTSSIYQGLKSPALGPRGYHNPFAYSQGIVVLLVAFSFISESLPINGPAAIIIWHLTLLFIGVVPGEFSIITTCPFHCPVTTDGTGYQSP